MPEKKTAAKPAATKKPAATEEEPPTFASTVERIMLLDAKPAHGSLTEALAAFQSEMPTISKASKATFAEYGGGERSYGYADLADITKVAMPLLGKHGLAFTTIPTLDSDHGFVLVYELRHESGDYISGVYPLKPRETPEQHQGSAITYARRYTLCAVTGIAPGGDDDDAAAASSYQAPASSREPQQANVANPISQAAQAWLDKISGAENYGELKDIYREANALGEVSQVVAEALTARKGVVPNVSESSEPVHQPAGFDTTPAPQ